MRSNQVGPASPPRPVLPQMAASAVYFRCAARPSTMSARNSRSCRSWPLAGMSIVFAGPGVTPKSKVGGLGGGSPLGEGENPDDSLFPGQMPGTLACLTMLPCRKSSIWEVQAAPPSARPIWKGGGGSPPPFPVCFAAGETRLDPRSRRSPARKHDSLKVAWECKVELSGHLS